MTPFELVLQHYNFPKEIRGNPFDPHPLQIAVINSLAPLTTSGEWLDMGTGKTFVATACALYWKITQGIPCVVILPPVLIRQWARWLAMISPALSICEYEGTPAERAEKDLSADFVIVGIQIFKKEWTKFNVAFRGRRRFVIVDEATMIGNINSDAYQKVYDFCVGMLCTMLTGTPSDPPMRTYAMLTLTAPGSYRSMKHFENEHVDEVDFHKKPIAWKNLDLLNEKLKKNSARVLFKDMYNKSQTPFIDRIEYRLSPDHYKLYRKLSEEQLLELPEGGKIDGSTANRLIHALGQIILNPAHFSGKPEMRSATLDLIDQRLEGLAGGKLLVFAHYKLTIAQLVKHYSKYGAVQVNSAVTNKQKDLAKQRFIEDDKCKIIFVQYLSGGLGLDGLQWVCNHLMMIEPIRQPYIFRQSVARLDRGGQRHRVMVDVAIAQRTLQVRGFKDLVDNDGVASQIIRNAYELRKEIYGED